MNANTFTARPRYGYLIVAALVLGFLAGNASAVQTTSINMSSTLNMGYDSINGYNCIPINGSAIYTDENTTIGAYWTPPTEGLDGNCNFTGRTLDDFVNSGSGAIAVMVNRSCAWTGVSNMHALFTD